MRRRAKVPFRSITADDVRHYKKIAIALGETITIMQKIDKTIPRWPVR